MGRALNLCIMDPLTLMFISSIIPSLFSSSAALFQQKNEFGQQNDLLTAEQNFQREREDLAFQRSLPSSQYQSLLDAGFNPNLAAESVLGGNGNTVSSSGSPAAPSVASAIDAVSRSLNQGGQNMFDSMLKSAQIGNLEANTNKTDIESGILPRDFALRELSTFKQLEVWDKSVEKMSSEIGYNKEMTDLVKNQNMYYGRMSEAEIQVKQSQVFQACATAMNQLEQIQTQKHQQRNIDADTVLKGAQTATEAAKQLNLNQQTANLETEQFGIIWDNARKKIALDFENSIGGIPLTADAKDKVVKWSQDGDYKKIQDFFGCIFSSAMNQELGTAFGTPAKSRISIPGILQQEKYDFQKLYNMYNFPYWNPQ